MSQMLERAELAMRQEVERQVQVGGYYSGPRNGRPNYVDADLDYPALTRAVLMAVREPDEAMHRVGQDAQEPNLLAKRNDMSARPQVRGCEIDMQATAEDIVQPGSRHGPRDQFAAAIINCNSFAAYAIYDRIAEAAFPAMIDRILSEWEG